VTIIVNRTLLFSVLTITTLLSFSSLFYIYHFYYLLDKHAYLPEADNKN